MLAIELPFSLFNREKIAYLTKLEKNFHDFHVFYVAKVFFLDMK